MADGHGQQCSQQVVKEDTKLAAPHRLSNDECFTRARLRGQATFTVVAQDRSAPRIICEWIKENIETCPQGKLFEALARAIEMRDFHFRKSAD